MASTAVELMRRRFVGGQHQKNLFLEFDQPHGRLTSPSNTHIAQYTLTEDIVEGTSVLIRITVGENWERKSGTYIYNSSSASASRTALGKPVDGVIEKTFSWLHYGSNSFANIIAFPNTGSDIIPTIVKAELYII